ncbi:hypothetical protein Hypma_014497 [Hypsizygus marmoreus]|uniref:Uncharacterized protein n=1 Tax=Hypsizygus marmoreus TaxID=39966 RepID=A0A369JGH0_HYPMA|nr:hypothetical protein Hypma_014497 [Hypsizygus marmoreus]
MALSRRLYSSSLSHSLLVSRIPQLLHRAQARVIKQAHGLFLCMLKPPHPDHYHHHSHIGSPPMRPHPGETFARSASQHVPPPPWSRWGTVATPARPPSTQHSQGQSTSSRSTPQPLSSKKRKHEEFPEPEDFSRISSSSSSAPSSKRRAPPLPPPVSPPQPLHILAKLSHLLWL